MLSPRWTFARFAVSGLRVFAFDFVASSSKSTAYGCVGHRIFFIRKRPDRTLLQPLLGAPSRLWREDIVHLGIGALWADWSRARGPAPSAITLNKSQHGNITKTRPAGRRHIGFRYLRYRQTNKIKASPVLDPIIIPTHNTFALTLLFQN